VAAKLTFSATTEQETLRDGDHGASMRLELRERVLNEQTYGIGGGKWILLVQGGLAAIAVTQLSPRRISEYNVETVPHRATHGVPLKCVTYLQVRSVDPSE